LDWAQNEAIAIGWYKGKFVSISDGYSHARIRDIDDNLIGGRDYMNYAGRI
jgi:hypothetical protein